MFDDKIRKTKKGLMLDVILFALGVALILASVVEGWIPEALVLVFATRIIYGWVIIQRLKREKELASIY